MELATLETLESIVKENTKADKGVLYWEGERGIYGQIDWEKEDNRWEIMYRINHCDGSNYYIELMGVEELVDGVAQLITKHGINIGRLYSVIGDKIISY
jgi:hypothetical protein